MAVVVYQEKAFPVLESEVGTIWIPTLLSTIKVSLPMVLADDVHDEVELFPAIATRHEVSS